MEKKPEVRFKVDVVITEETLRDYLIQRTYSNAGIIIPTLFGIGFLYLAVTKWGQVDMVQWGAYLLFGLIFGIYSATHSGSVGDYILTVLAFIGVAVPSFFLALGSVYVFSLKLGWFPTGAMRTIGVELTGWAGFVDVVRHMTLPAIVMALPQTASITRYARSSMLDVIHEDFIRTARAKGLGEKRVIFVHALRNALIPIITLFGLSLPGLLGGSYIVESIFNWPGLGTLGIKAITAREYSELMALNLITAVLVLLGNFIADMLYTVADPRIRVSKGKGE